MEKPIDEYPLVLAVTPTSKGIAFAVFEGPTKPLDWGIKEARVRKNTICTKHVRSLINFYQPAVLILEKPTKRSRHMRSGRVTRLIDKIAKHVKDRLPVIRYSHNQVVWVFEQFGVATKFGIAQRITELLPEFKSKLPPYRKTGDARDERMEIFYAIALTLTYYYLND